MLIEKVVHSHQDVPEALESSTFFACDEGVVQYDCVNSVMLVHSTYTLKVSKGVLSG